MNRNLPDPNHCAFERALFWDLGWALFGWVAAFVGMVGFAIVWLAVTL